MKKYKSYKKSISDNLSEVSKQYLINLNSIHLTAPEIIKFLIEQYKSLDKEFIEFIKKNGIKSKKNEKIVYTLKPEHIVKARTLDKNREMRIKSLKNTTNSLFVSMCSNYEVFISDFIRLIIPKVIWALSNNDGESTKIGEKDNTKTLAYSEILSHKSMISLKSKIIEIETEKFTRNKSYIEQINWIEKKFKIEVKKNLPRLKSFEEISKRRNLCVHNDGKIDKEYLNNLTKYDIKLSELESKKKRFFIKKKYIDYCYSVLIETGVVITSLIWRKLLNSRENVDKADMLLNSEICYQLLLSEEYELAKRLLEFSRSIISAKSREGIKSTCEINIALCNKFLNNEAEMNKILDKITYPLDNKAKYEIAIYSLKNDYIKASRLMTKTPKKKNFSETQYREFPLFKDFRNTKEFGIAFKRLFKKDFKVDFTLQEKDDNIAS